MFLRKGNVFLRAVEPSDAHQIYMWENDMLVWKVSDTIAPYSMFQIEQFILNGGDIFANKQLRIMIDLKEGEVVRSIGSVDIYDFDPLHKRAGVGIFIEDAFRNKGFANIALELTEDYVFNTLDLHQIYCLISAENHQSKKLFEGRNYLHTGTRKDWLKNINSYTDQLQYQLINPFNQK
ncbi:MAG: GNAT family N-acetyltransferase [Bacteroidales bacterium]|nr:GNAT family N-acetyltransferase [Bacteroidales bacterium]